VNFRDILGPRAPISIRVRLGLALALALLPVLFLSIVQATLEFRREARDERASLVAASERGAATAKARLESARVLLQTLGSAPLATPCAPRLRQVAERIPGYENVIRFDAAGRVSCAARSAPADPDVVARPWFQALARGDPVVVTRDPGAAYAAVPSLLAAAPATDATGHFDGATAAVISLSSLGPENASGGLPLSADVALTDQTGRYISATDANRFPVGLGPMATQVGKPSGAWLQSARNGERRLYASAPLVGGQLFLVLSAPAPGLASWAWLNPVTALALPLLAFTLALAAVLFVAERGVVRWIAYLQRIAALYARGRFAVRPVRAEQAPPEIRDLAETLGDMAAAIAARDEALTGHLAQKDAMLREIHHRVKNNLQVISSLLNLQERTLSDPSARAAVADTRQRIAALALIYRALYQSPDLRRVDLHDFLEELIGQMVTGESGLAAPIRSDLVCDPLVIDPDFLAPLALFAVEAISNARKHGLDENGLLSVKFEVEGDQAVLQICDTGHAGERATVGPGVGRTLMTAFARQLRGVVSFQPNPKGGLTTSLTFPNPEAKPDTHATPPFPPPPQELQARG